MTIYVLNAKVYFKTKKFLFYIFAQNSNKKPRDVQMGKAKVFFFASLIKQIFLKRFLKKKQVILSYYENIYLTINQIILTLKLF